MVLFITAIIETVNLTVGESSPITKDKFMKDNGEMEWSKAKDFGKVFEDKLI